MVERVISGDRGEWMLDLDSGRTQGPVVIGGDSSIPEEMDLSFVHSPSPKGLRPTAIAALELQFRHGDDRDWDIYPASVGWRLSIVERSHPAQGEADPAAFHTAPLVSTQDEFDDLPATFIFRTRQGAEGVLQIVELTDSPLGVKIRYKVVVKAIGPGSEAPGSRRGSRVPFSWEPGR